MSVGAINFLSPVSRANLPKQPITVGKAFSDNGGSVSVTRHPNGSFSARSSNGLSRPELFQCLSKLGFSPAGMVQGANGEWEGTVKKTPGGDQSINRQEEAQQLAKQAFGDSLNILDATIA
jgi:hypothetical protein